MLMLRLVIERFCWVLIVVSLDAMHPAIRIAKARNHKLFARAMINLLPNEFF